jgi:hypothetical protein
MSWSSPVSACVLALLLGACGAAPLGSAYPPEFLGVAAPPQSGQRTIVITAQTKWINVEGGEIIRFVVGEHEFGWSFDGPIETFDLRQVAPPGMLDHAVMAYVLPNPLYRREASLGPTGRHWR